jgi:hypothetical protein
MVVRPECRRECQEEEGGGVRPRIAGETIWGRNGQEPSDLILDNSTFGPLLPRETEEMDDGIKESWHDANEDGWEMAQEKFEERTKKRPDRGPNRTTLRFGWSAIWSWIVRSGPGSA